jgi:Ca2+-binding RTX toxin-like protein
MQGDDNDNDNIIKGRGGNDTIKGGGGADNFIQIAKIHNITGLTDEAALETAGNLIKV